MVESSANTEPTRSPVTLPSTFPVRLPVTLPVTLPDKFPVTLPVKAPVNAPYTLSNQPSAHLLPVAPISLVLSTSGVTSDAMPEKATVPVSTATPPKVVPSPVNSFLVSVV